MTIYEINQTKVDGGELFQSAHLLEKKMWKVGVNSSTNKVLNYKATPVMISGVIDWSSFRCRRAAAVTPEFITNDGILRHAKTKTRLQFSPGDDHGAQKQRWFDILCGWPQPQTNLDSEAGQSDWWKSRLQLRQ